jgi:hypothetical protein
MGDLGRGPLRSSWQRRLGPRAGRRRWTGERRALEHARANPGRRGGGSGIPGGGWDDAQMTQMLRQLAHARL